jgi:PAS domain S-box-containing protein
MPGDLKADPPAAGHPTLARLFWRDAEAAMMVLDADQRIQHVNPAAAAALRLRGYQTGQRLCETADELHSIDGRTIPRDQWPAVRALRGETVVRELVSMRCGNLGVRRMVLSAQPIELDDGTVGALITSHDVTDSWQFAEHSQSELAQLGQLLAGASDYAIIMLDPSGRVETWSAAAERMHGYTQEQAIGLNYASFFDDGDQAAGLPAQILKTAVSEGKAQVEGKRVRADGSVFWAQAALTAIRDEAGELRGFVKVTHDVSERRASERAVVELNEVLEQRVAERTFQLEQQAADLAAVNGELEAFSYSVSHDLRAPLRAMSGFARIIEQDYGTQIPAEALGYLGKVIENARQMGNLIDALLSFSRLQRQQMEQGPINMTDLARECWTALAPVRGDRRIEFVLARLPFAIGDRQLIRQVWMNLLDNAIKYTGGQATARVEVQYLLTDDVSMLTYLVRDNGAGFDMRYAGKLGQVFQRLHHSDEFTGTGIGLALAQRIVQRHGGQLTAIGEPDVGATFGFSLRATP